MDYHLANIELALFTSVLRAISNYTFSRQKKIISIVAISRFLPRDNKFQTISFLLNNYTISTISNIKSNTISSNLMYSLSEWSSLN